MALTTQKPPPFEVGTASDQRQRHWLGLPVRSRTEGTFDDILSTLPHFGRQPFAMASLNGDELGVNSYLDMVYRLPIRRVRGRCRWEWCRRTIGSWITIT